MTTANRDFTHQLLMDAGMRVLDVGCGSGDVTFMLSKLVTDSGEVIGIDHDRNALDIANERKITSSKQAQPTFIQSGLLDLAESVGTFDAIVGRRVLMYQADTVATATELARHLKPGGVMIFQEHDTTMAPASVDSFELHRKAQGWIQQMIAYEGADLHIGFNLHNIADAKGANFACLLQFFHGAPGAMDITVWLVNQIQVNVIKLQSIQGSFELRFSAFVMGILQPKSGRDKKFVTRDTGLFQCVPDLGFILVRRSGIDQAVSRIDGINNGSFAFRCIRHLEDTKAQQGHFNTVVQFYNLHDVVLQLFCRKSITQTDLFN